MTFSVGHRGKLMKYTIRLSHVHLKNSKYMLDIWGWSRCSDTQDTILFSKGNVE